MADTSQQVLAVFDFDHTLITTDSFLKYIALITGWPRLILYLGRSLFSYCLNPTIINQPHDFPTAIKERLMAYSLKGLSRKDLHTAADRLKTKIKWNEAVVSRLKEHSLKGHRIVVASGGLEIYLPILLRDFPLQDIVGTKVEMVNDECLGLMTDGNCVRSLKATKIISYIEKTGPYADTWGYGNLPHDLPMLKLLNHKLVIRGHEIIDFTNQLIS